MPEKDTDRGNHPSKERWCRNETIERRRKNKKREREREREIGGFWRQWNFYRSVDNYGLTRRQQVPTRSNDNWSVIDSCRETTRSQFGCKCEICFVCFPCNIRMDRKHILANKKKKRKRNKMVRNSFEHLRQSFVSINRWGEATTIVAVRFSAHFLDYQLREQKF